MERIESLISDCESWILPELQNVFDSESRDDITVKAALYSLLAGGKRLRPLMMKMTYEMMGGDRLKEDDVRYFAASLERIHTYSLIHDDLPAMDNDDRRRGQPTCHKMFGEGIAVLAGDLLLNRAYERLFTLCLDRPEYTYAARMMCDRAGINGMVGGQSIDLDCEGRNIPIEKLYELQEKKTGALIESAIVTPYYILRGTDSRSAANDSSVMLLKALASHIGLAFQIKDDILDVTSSSEVLGKNVGKDARDEKSTFVTLLGFDNAKTKLADEIDLASDVLNKLTDFGYNTNDYRVLTDYLYSRDK